MASLIPGFEYDIFISYRQKDNKYDGWVTAFVDNLKKELEATFKEEISVYFDINPHDGLLETHDVDASLKDKLKCLVFIPIISRTYCDPKSFAWEHEFKAFIEQASKDQYGLKIKLPGGNVANRVLPVQIHELDADDKKLIEGELGGFLRGIEFIYKSPGINRPLLPKEENPQENLNHTNYRDQINKVANAIKEIITGLKNQDRVVKEASEGIDEVKPSGRKNQRTKILADVLIILVLIVAGYFTISKVLKPKEQLEKSIAILPFRNDSPDPNEENTAFINSLMDELISNLQAIKELRVLGRTSVEQYRNNTSKSNPEIARELGVTYIVEGSGQKYDSTFNLRVRLINAKGKESQIWTKPIQQEIRGTKDIYRIQSQIAQAIVVELKAIMTPEEKQLIERTSTTNLDALYFYQRGKEEYTKYLLNKKDKESLNRAEGFYHQALKYDSAYAQAFTGLAMVYWVKHYYPDYLSENFMDSVPILCDIALSFDNQLSEAHTLKGTYYNQTGKWEQAVEEFDKAMKLNPNDWMAYRGKGAFYYETDWINYIKYYQKAASINHGPELPGLLLDLGYAYGSAGFFEKARQHYQDKLKLDGDSVNFYNELARIEFWQGNFNKSIEFSIKGIAIDTTNLDILTFIASNYNRLGRNAESLKYYKKYIEILKSQGDVPAMYLLHRIGYAFSQNGNKETAEYYFNEQIKYCKRSIELGRQYEQILYTYYDLAGVYAFKGERDKAYENLRIFNKKPMMSFWMVSLIKTDPLFNSLRSEPEFQQIVRDVEAKYQAENERVRKWLEEQGML